MSAEDARLRGLQRAADARDLGISELEDEAAKHPHDTYSYSEQYLRWSVKSAGAIRSALDRLKRAREEAHERGEP